MNESNMELFRCPKCGNRPELIFNENDVEKRYIVKCTNDICNYNIYGYGMIKSAAKNMWNNKATSSTYIANKLLSLNS